MPSSNAPGCLQQNFGCRYVLQSLLISMMSVLGFFKRESPAKLLTNTISRRESELLEKTYTKFWHETYIFWHETYIFHWLHNGTQMINVSLTDIKSLSSCMEVIAYCKRTCAVTCLEFLFIDSYFFMCCALRLMLTSFFVYFFVLADLSFQIKQFTWHMNFSHALYKTPALFSLTT